MAAGRKFYAAVEAETITEDEQRQHVPLFVPLLSSGPSVDFILGRVFQFASDKASDEVTTKDNSGLPLPMDKWLMDDELIQAKAKWHDQKGNCDLLCLPGRRSPPPRLARVDPRWLQKDDRNAFCYAITVTTFSRQGGLRAIESLPQSR